MVPHKFSSGDIVRLRGGVYSRRSPDHQYEIRQCLPPDALIGEPPKYRVVNMTDGHERVVLETQIERRAAPTGERPPASPVEAVTQLKRPSTPRSNRPPVHNIIIDLLSNRNGAARVSDEPKPHEKTQQDPKATPARHGMPGPQGHLDQQDERGTGGKPRSKDKKESVPEGEKAPDVFTTVSARLANPGDDDIV